MSKEPAYRIEEVPSQYQIRRKFGMRYAIVWPKWHSECYWNEAAVVRSLGQAMNSFNRICDFAKDRRWYCGKRKVADNNDPQVWMAFKTEVDRTLALMLL